jgi:hypothetical protein
LPTSSDSIDPVETALPLGMKGLKLSKVPRAPRRSEPPFGASGLT